MTAAGLVVSGISTPRSALPQDIRRAKVLAQNGQERLLAPLQSVGYLRRDGAYKIYYRRFNSLRRSCRSVPQSLLCPIDRSGQLAVFELGSAVGSQLCRGKESV